ncbi:MAG: S-adenosyl-l-methionine hydroxide adenosyltransferase family protein [Candidatus Bathyarchaeia archaeon]
MILSRRPIIALLTDLGGKDPYVSEMKAVILSICPDATIVDITHEVKKFDVRMGAYILSSAVPYFPEGSIFVCVVDPGVGTKRRLLAVRTKRGHYLIGPDNGLLVPASQREGIDAVVDLQEKRFMLPSVSPTFHGRDVMAPVAANIAKGAELDELGPRIDDILTPGFSAPEVGRDEIVGEVLHVDDFGNIITNIEGSTIKRTTKVGGELAMDLGRRALRLKLCRTYADSPDRTFLALIGSSGLLEIAMNQGNAAETLSINRGDSVRVHVLRTH